MAKQTEKQALADWQEFRDNTRRATPVDLNETAIDKKKRITRLEANDEDWFKYYFPNFYTSEPAPFHKASTKLVMTVMELFLVRSWARELSKSGRTMMEDIKLALTGKKRNFLEVSSTYDNAVRLLKPYKIIFESNQRIINDYGEQVSLGSWEDGEFKIRAGASFRALGAGQSPRGTRNDAYRPDKINIDDIDTDEECRNPDRIKAKLKWIQEALIPTRSISNALTIVVNGNIIAKYCCVTELGKLADKWEVVNIRDKHGKSTWPQKNSEEQIDRVLSTISYNSAQKEYFNNPVVEGDVFRDIRYDKCPPIASCEQVLVYSDPATSNKDKGNASTKGVVVIGYKNLNYYIYRVWLDTMGNSKYVDCLFEAYQYLNNERVDVKRVYVENNSLQDPFYEQVITPLIRQREKERRYTMPVTPDKRKKPEKFYRIEGTLEPLHRAGRIIFNEKEKNSPHMQRMENQWLGVSQNSKLMDGPDCIEGGVYIISHRVTAAAATYTTGARSSFKY